MLWKLQCVETASGEINQSEKYARISGMMPRFTQQRHVVPSVSFLLPNTCFPELVFPYSLLERSVYRDGVY